jgi:hypothetical protein
MISLYLIAGIIGVMLFFSVVVAPTIFKALPQEWAGVYVRQFFPKYYFVLGFFCLIAGILANSNMLKTLTLICAFLFAISLWFLTPSINKAKDENNIKKFNLLHSSSVALNIIILGMLFYSVWDA